MLINNVKNEIELIHVLVKANVSTLCSSKYFILVFEKTSLGFKASTKISSSNPKIVFQQSTRIPKKESYCVYDSEKNEITFRGQSHYAIIDKSNNRIRKFRTLNIKTTSITFGSQGLAS